jgi:N-acetylglutamate synthase-like GNAT family acetyltransferase
MIQNIRLRMMKVTDLAAVYALVQNAIEVSYADVYPPEAIEFFKNHHSQENILQDIERGYIVMAESNGQLLGTGTIIGTSIRRVFINPEYQHHGIGKIIANKLERKARENGMAKLDLSASLKSCQFWEAMGFVSTGEFALPVANGQKLIFYEMTKTL